MSSSSNEASLPTRIKRQAESLAEIRARLEADRARLEALIAEHEADGDRTEPAPEPADAAADSSSSPSAVKVEPAAAASSLSASPVTHASEAELPARPPSAVKPEGMVAPSSTRRTLPSSLFLPSTLRTFGSRAANWIAPAPDPSRVGPAIPPSDDAAAVSAPRVLSAASSSSSGGGEAAVHAAALLKADQALHDHQMGRLVHHFEQVLRDSSLLDDGSGGSEFNLPASPPAAAAASGAPADAPAQPRFIEFVDDDSDDNFGGFSSSDEDSDGAYGSGGGVFDQRRLDAQAAQFVSPDTVTDLSLRYLGAFIDRVCVTMGLSAEDSHMAMDWSDRVFRTKQWSNIFKFAHGIGWTDDETNTRIKQRLQIKQDFEREVLQRLGSVRFAITSALFWIQNRQAHTSVKLWDIIHSETWSVWFLELVSLLHTMNGPSVRTAWQIKDLRNKYHELMQWFDKGHDFGAPPVIPSSYYKFQLRPPFSRTTVAATDREHIEDMQTMVQRATGDFDLTFDQTEHLVHTEITMHFPGLSLKSLLRRTHSKIVFTQLLAIRHSLSDTIHNNKVINKRKLGKARPTAHMTVFMNMQQEERRKWLMNFSVHGCACVA